MTQEDKQLLLRDLCARLPYGVKTYYKTAGWEDKNYTLSPQVIDNFLIRRDVVVKPYLRPMSSMTEEEYNSIKPIIGEHRITFHAGGGFTLNKIKTFTLELIEWLNAYHFDYRGLIEKGLAIEVTEDNNPYED